ncbi:MAG: hypothetical protein ACRDA4_02655 [Filifactoraceae bacterium]
MKNTKKIFTLTLATFICLTNLSFGNEKTEKDKNTKKLITVEIATKIALEKNLDLKYYDSQKEKVQANIDAYFNNIISNGDALSLPGAESSLAAVQYGGSQAFLSKNKIERGKILRTEAIKSTVENSFANISKQRRERLALEEKYNREAKFYTIEEKKKDLGVISKVKLEENRLALLELKTALESKTTDLTIAYGELNKLLKLPKFEEYTIEDYQVEYIPLDWTKEDIDSYISQVPDYNMDVLNKRDEAEFNRNEINNILAINDGKEPYMSIKADSYIADFSASQLAEESIIAARDKYNNLLQLQSGITALEQNIKTLELQKNNLEARVKTGQVSKLEVDKLNGTIKDTQNNLASQKEAYMNLKRIFQNRYMVGLA